jgi:hypothetical protein
MLKAIKSLACNPKIIGGGFFLFWMVFIIIDLAGGLV